MFDLLLFACVGAATFACARSGRVVGVNKIYSAAVVFAIGSMCSKTLTMTSAMCVSQLMILYSQRLNIIVSARARPMSLFDATRMRALIEHYHISHRG